jgi:thioredoxin 1
MNNLVLYDFFSRTCGPCRIIEPTVDKIKVDYPHITVKKIDIYENQDMSQKFKIFAMPTFVLIDTSLPKNKQEIGRVIGANKDKLFALIK